MARTAGQNAAKTTYIFHAGMARDGVGLGGAGKVVSKEVRVKWRCLSLSSPLLFDDVS